MMGNDQNLGIIPLAIEEIFQKIDATKDELKFIIKVGYIEIYNEKIFDLLNQNSELKIFEDHGNVVTKHKQVVANSVEEVMLFLSIGNSFKRMGETIANNRSSRSHTIFQITIESQYADEAKTSKLYLVDLAGSEKPDSTSLSFNEGLHINKSLLALGKIIRGLSGKNSSMVNVNFRESKLTRILSPALGGNSLTAVLCTASPAALEETFHTLSFAQNARRVKVNATLNIVNGESKLLKALRAENARLRKEVLRLSNNSSPFKNISTPLTPVILFKRRNNRLESESSPAKRLKLDVDNECLIVLEQEVVQSLIDQVADVEMEIEEKLSEINQQHEEAMENQKNVIEALELDFLKSNQDHENVIKTLKDELVEARKKVEIVTNQREQVMEQLERRNQDIANAHEKHRLVRLNIIYKITQLQKKYHEKK